jgi:multiple sugar transport system ATP-binding protein
MLRVQMRIELAKLHKSLGATMIYVTHDQVEAMTLADRVVVLDKGVVMQIGAPLELYTQPKNKFVASFIGSPAMNFLGVEAQAGDSASLRIALKGTETGWNVPISQTPDPRFKPTELGIRPEHIDLVDASSADAIPGKVALVERLGNATIVYVETAAGQIVVEGTGEQRVSADEIVALALDKSRTHIFLSDGQALR